MKMPGAGAGLSDLVTLFEAGAVGGLTDGQLLERFVARRDAAAFEVLVRRHGPMVWSVCRRILRDHHDAEDAFQATFLVLARKAAAVSPREMLPNWLFGVARQTAAKAKIVAARRGMREKLVGDLPEPEVAQSLIDDGLGDVLDQELSRLPARYRTPIILCHLEGKGHRQAAEQLGWPIGTLSGRLSRARGMLARRLSRRGVVLSTATLAALSSRHASAGVPESVVKTTIAAAGPTGAVSAGVVSATVVSLAEGVMKAMLWTKIRTGSLIAAVLAVIGIAMVSRTTEARRTTQKAEAASGRQRPAQQRQELRATGSRDLLQEVDWALTRVDLDKNTISALARWTWNSMANDQFADSGIQTGLHLSFRDLPVAKDAEILVNGKPGQLKDLAIDNETFQQRYGAQMILGLSEDGSTITRIDARSKNSYFFLRGVDGTKRTITLSIGASGLLSKQLELPVAEDAIILIGRGKPRLVEGRFSDLKAGMRISFELASMNGQIVVRGIRAEE